MEMSFATSEFYGKAVFHILCPCIFFLKWFTKKNVKQLVIWPVVFLSSCREGWYPELSSNHAGKLEGAVCCQ